MLTLMVVVLFKLLVTIHGKVHEKIIPIDYIKEISSTTLHRKHIDDSTL